MSTNHQLWQDKTGVPGEVRESPVPTKVEDNEVLIKVHSWALNPCDVMLQEISLPFVQYPVILGCDVAGTVELVGAKAADRFKKGDRIAGFTANNGFQEYVPLNHLLITKIPDSLSFSDAVVFGLCITTSSYSLFGKDHLALNPPSLNPNSASTGKSVLVWGGSSAVGSNAIQLLKAAGYDPIATCSPKNFDYVKSLGASKAFDYSSPTVVDDVVAELDKGTCAGIYLAAGKVADACQVSHKSKQKIFVSSSNPINPGDAPEGVEAKMAFGSGAEMFEEVHDYIWKSFIFEGLTKGELKVAPPPQVVSHKGVYGIQDALNIMKKGVSAKKLVVEAN